MRLLVPMEPGRGDHRGRWSAVALLALLLAGIAATAVSGMVTIHGSDSWTASSMRC
ncbi:MAG: hypothetical protein ICV72_10595, partial [Aldersonia sp.]|nr:hypothetical protein [Aldersonia sp.]